MKQIEFSTSDKGKWLDVVYQAHQKYNRADYPGENTLIGFAPEIQINTLKPFHIVTYACFDINLSNLDDIDIIDSFNF